MWGRRIDFEERNDNSIGRNQDIVNRVEKVDAQFAYSSAFKNPSLNFLNRFDNFFRRIKVNKRRKQRRELNRSLVARNMNLSQKELVQLETGAQEQPSPKQISIKFGQRYLNLVALIIFLISLAIAIPYTYRHYEDYQSPDMNIFTQ